VVLSNVDRDWAQESQTTSSILVSLIPREIRFRTHINIPPCLCHVWFVEYSLFKSTLTIVFLDGVPHVDRHERFINNQTGNVFPGIAILKFKTIDFSVEFHHDFFILN
jgi:hypothetical protein